MSFRDYIYCVTYYSTKINPKFMLNSHFLLVHGLKHTIMCDFPTSNVVCGPAIFVSPGSLLEMQKFRPHPRPSESAPTV